MDRRRYVFLPTVGKCILILSFQGSISPQIIVQLLLQKNNSKESVVNRADKLDEKKYEQKKSFKTCSCGHHLRFQTKVLSQLFDRCLRSLPNPTVNLCESWGRPNLQKTCRMILRCCVRLSISVNSLADKKRPNRRKWVTPSCKKRSVKF